MVRPEGQAVVVAWGRLSRKPWGPSFMLMGGMLRRVFLATLPTVGMNEKNLENRPQLLNQSTALSQTVKCFPLWPG